MDNPTQMSGLRTFSILSIVFGVLGGAFYWFVPMGIVLSMAGLMLGFVDAMDARRRSLSYRLSIAGTVVSAAALVLDIVILAMGLQSASIGWVWGRQ